MAPSRKNAASQVVQEAALPPDELKAEVATLWSEVEQTRAEVVKLQGEERELEEIIRGLEETVGTTADPNQVPALVSELEQRRARLEVLKPSLAASERRAERANRTWQASNDRLFARNLEKKNAETLVSYRAAVLELEESLTRASRAMVEAARLRMELLNDTRSAQLYVKRGAACLASGPVPDVELLPHPESLAGWRAPGKIRDEVGKLLGKASYAPYTF